MNIRYYYYTLPFYEYKNKSWPRSTESRCGSQGAEDATRANERNDVGACANERKCLSSDCHHLRWQCLLIRLYQPGLYVFQMWAAAVVVVVARIFRRWHKNDNDSDAFVRKMKAVRVVLRLLLSQNNKHDMTNDVRCR